MEEGNSSKRDLSFKEILNVIWSHKIIIIIMTVVFTACAFCWSYFLTKRQYVSTSKVIVDNGRTSVVLGSGDITASRSIADSYKIALDGNKDFAQIVADKLDNKYTVGQILGAISINVVEETEILQIVVVSTDPQFVKDVSEAAFDAAINDRFETIFNTGSVHALEGVSDVAPVGKGTTTKTLLGLVAGLAVGLIVAFIINIFDVRVKSAKDVVDRYDLPLLAEVSQ